jgi:protein-S-isoprenylcysteine O-methyltransferase Ste14
MSWWVVGLGYFLLTTGVAITAWAQAVNRFFEPSVRIQTEHGHRVVDTGPYAIIRHPGYAAACLLFAGMALALGSWWHCFLRGPPRCCSCCEPHGKTAH